jgi:hypothetical protein
MKIIISEVIAQSDVLYVPSRKQEDGRLAKSYIRLRELGGQYENEYLCTLFGNLATCNFAEGDLVAAALRFQTHEVNGQYYQDIIANDIRKL